MSRAGHIICWCVAVLVAVAPLPFGSVRPVPLAALQVSLMTIALVWCTLRMRAGLTPMPWSDPVLLGGGALLIYGLAQILPLPAALVARLSPAAAAIWTDYAPPPTGWIPISIDPYATWHACILTACWTLAALIVRHNARDLKGRLTIAWGLVAGGAFQAGYGLFEFISGRQKILGYDKIYFTDVATGTFISRNNYAGYLAMAIPFALALALRGGRRRRARSLKRALAKTTGRSGFRTTLLLMAALLMATAILMSRSRMGIMSAAFALLIGGLALGIGGRARRFAVISVGVVALAALFASQIDILPVLDRFRIMGGEFGTGYNRLQVWRQSLGLISSYPLFGSGMGTWEAAFSPFRDDAAQVRVDFAHNDYLEFLAETGLAGCLILLAAGAYALSGRRRRRVGGAPPDEIGLAAGVALTAIGLHSLTDFHLSIPADALTVCVLLGLVLRPPGPAGETGDPPAYRAAAGAPARGRIPAWALCAAMILALVVAAVSPAAAHVTSRRAGIVEETVADVDATPPDGTAASPDDDLCPACRVEPLNPERYVEAAGRARRRLLRDVETLVRARTIGVEPAHATRVYLSERIDRTLGLLQHGIRLAPADGRAHLEEGLLRFGRFALSGLPAARSEEFDRAVAAFERSLALAPWHAAWHRKVALVTAPLADQCRADQRRFIEAVTLRARALDPESQPLVEAAARLGL